ncbi:MULTISPECIES: hypothetical protein [unclassified Anabaena]
MNHSTVRVHAILHKIKVSDRSQAVVMAMQKGLIKSNLMIEE